MEAKRTTKTDVKFKDIQIINNSVIEFESGEKIDLISLLSEVYGIEPFTLSCTTKLEETIELENNE
jgi:hypothetical protein